MTTHEAARIAGVTPTTIRRWIRQERLAASVRRTDGPPGFALDITEEALAAAIADQRRPGRPYKTAPKAAKGETSHEHLQQPPSPQPMARRQAGAASDA